MRLAAVSVDLDEIGAYYAIHGLAPLPGASVGAVYDVGLPRLVGWARALGIPLTLFAIGSDLLREENAASLREALAGGNEVGNHSLDHRYDLTRCTREEMRRQVLGGRDAIREATGVTPTGFRAPGYTITDELFDVLEEAGVVYDSSVFPCPAYHAAKALAVGAIHLRGRTSRSILGDPRVLAAPVGPYRRGRPYFRAGDGLREIPIQVTRGARLPYIGTSLTLASDGASRSLTRMVEGMDVINLELHGIDALDRTDGLEELAAHQLDVRVPVARKLRRLTAAVESLIAAGYTFVRLEEVARRVLP